MFSLSCWFRSPRARDEAAFPLLLPLSTQAPELFSLKRPVLQLNVLAFGWKDRKPKENRIFDNFVQLLGNYLDNIDLDTVQEGAAERVGQRESHSFAGFSAAQTHSAVRWVSTSPVAPKSGAGPRGRGTGLQLRTAPAAPAPVQSAGGASAAQPGMSGRLKRSPALLFPRPGLRGEGAGGGDREGREGGGGGRREEGGAGAGGASAERAPRARLTDRRGGCKMAQAAVLPLRPRRS